MKFGILVLTDFDVETAATRRVKLFAKGMAALGHEVHLVIPVRFNEGPLQMPHEGYHVHWGVMQSLETWATVPNRLRARLAALNILKKLGAQGLNWLMLYNLGFESAAATLLARSAGVKVLTEYCDMRVRSKHAKLEDYARFYWQKSGDQIVPRMADLNVAISRYLLDWLKKAAPSTPALIIPPLVDVDQFTHSAEAGNLFRSRQNIPPSIPLIAYVGGFWHVEGVADLLKAASILKKRGCHFHVSISGRSPPDRDCDDVEALVGRWDVSDRVTLTGWLKTGDVLGVLSAADVVVAPKIDHLANRAGVPTKLTEYLAMGKPVVTTRVGDIPLYVEDRVNAMVGPPGDAEKMADAIECLIRDESLRKQISAEARKTAVEVFDYRAAASRLEKALFNGTGAEPAP